MAGAPGRLEKAVLPGRRATLSVNLQAPNKAGAYTASWRVMDASGIPFGSVLNVSILVNPPTATLDPNVAAAQTSAYIETIVADQMTGNAIGHETAVAQMTANMSAIETEALGTSDAINTAAAAALTDQALVTPPAAP
jgi:methionine-rich copper-binding protein CopC